MLSMNRLPIFRSIGILCLMFLVSGCISSAPTLSGQLPPITTDRARLLAGGQLFEVRGVNYIRPSSADPAKCAALQFGADANCPWDIAPIAADMDHLRGLGVNTMRVFLN